MVANVGLSEIWLTKGVNAQDINTNDPTTTKHAQNLQCSSRDKIKLAKRQWKQKSELRASYAPIFVSDGRSTVVKPTSSNKLAKRYEPQKTAKNIEKMQRDLQ